MNWIFLIIKYDCHWFGGKKYISYLQQLCNQRDNLKIKLIYGQVVSDFQYKSDTVYIPFRYDFIFASGYKEQ